VGSPGIEPKSAGMVDSGKSVLGAPAPYPLSSCVCEGGGIGVAVLREVIAATEYGDVIDLVELSGCPKKAEGGKTRVCVAQIPTTTDSQQNVC